MILFVIRQILLPLIGVDYEYNIDLSEDNILTNSLYSIGLNLSGYVKAISLAIPLGFIIALFPITKYMFNKYIDAMRYIPITGLIGVFIAWFGIGFEMKSNFLTLGILVYLLPVIVQRVYETERVHLDTVWTLGANSWQLFTKVYFPSVMSKVFVDIRVITAISWTYIIIAEMAYNEGGLGSMIYLASRQGRIDVIFAILIFIVFIGLMQDQLFQLAERKIFKYKFEKK
jgi:NitT/TauT family transport system permease protein